MTLKERTRQELIDILVNEYGVKRNEVEHLGTKELKHKIAFLRIRESEWF